MRTPAAIAVSMALVACGGSGPDRRDTGGPTHRQLQTEMRSGCAQMFAGDNQIRRDVTDAAEAGDEDRAAFFLEDRLTVLEPGVKRFARLRPPEPDRAAFARFRRAIADEVRVTRDYVAALKANDTRAMRRLNAETLPILEARRAAAMELGVPECAPSTGP